MLKKRLMSPKKEAPGTATVFVRTSCISYISLLGEEK